MSIATYDPTQDIISVTKAAARHFRKQLDNQAQQSVRISVKESGCTGFAFVLDYTNEFASDDFIVSADFDVKIGVAKDAEQYIRGTEIDFVFEGVNQTLKYNNPNAKDYCGCGESFNV